MFHRHSDVYAIVGGETHNRAIVLCWGVSITHVMTLVPARALELTDRGARLVQLSNFQQHHLTELPDLFEI
jgi:predicted AAA+ superfamily ATPase